MFRCKVPKDLIIKLLTMIKSEVLALVECIIFMDACSILIRPIRPLHRATGSFKSVPMQNLALCLFRSPTEWNAILQLSQMNSLRPSIFPRNDNVSSQFFKTKLIYRNLEYLLGRLPGKNELHLLTDEILFVGNNHLGKGE